jgi:hypothetical protein
MRAQIATTPGWHVGLLFLIAAAVTVRGLAAGVGARALRPVTWRGAAMCAR